MGERTVLPAGRSAAGLAAGAGPALAAAGDRRGCGVAHCRWRCKRLRHGRRHVLRVARKTDDFLAFLDLQFRKVGLFQQVDELLDLA
jgi:hypothetical protein